MADDVRRDLQFNTKLSGAESKETGGEQDGGEGRDQQNGWHPPLAPRPSETARFVFHIGALPVPVKRGQKDPHRQHWEQERRRLEDVERDFPDDANIGILLGGKGPGNLVDVDLDTVEAVRIGAEVLPETGLRWGRKSKPNSHYLYQLLNGDSLAKTLAWNDPTPPKRPADDAKDGKDRKDARLLELRWNGQTIAPGSVNTASGHEERVCFEDGGNGYPATVPSQALVACAPVIAACSLLARAWHEGNRHDLSQPVAGLFFHGGLAEDEAKRLMRLVCIGARDDQLDDRLRSVEDTYRNGANGVHVTGGQTLEDYLGEPRVKKLREWLGLKGKKQVGILGPDLLPLAADGDGDRFANRFTGRVKYVALEAQWYVYSEAEGRWLRDDVEDIREKAKEVVRDFRRLVGERQSQCGQNGVAPYEVCARYSAAMGGTGAVSAMLESARSREDIRATPDDFDAHPEYLNCANGTLELDIETGEVGWHAHRPEDLLTMRSPVFYEGEDATHELIEEWKRRFFPEADRLDFLTRLAGDIVHGYPKRDGVNLVGETHSGKSMTLKLFSNALGDYAASLEYTSLMRNPHKGGDTPRPDLWRVRRKRLVTVSEIPPEVKLDEALLKAMLSGGDKTNIRTLFDRTGGRDVEWATSLWMSGNQAYGPRAGDDAAYERLHVLRCDHQVAREERDDRAQMATLDPAVTGGAVLALMVRGFRLLRGRDKGHVIEPESSVRAKAEVRSELDEFTPVIEKLFEVTGDPNDAVKKSEAWERALGELKEANGGNSVREPRQKQREFEAALKWRVGSDHTHSEGRWGGNVRYWPGLRWSEYVTKNWLVSQPDWKDV